MSQRQGTPLHETRFFQFWEEGLAKDLAFYCTLRSLELEKSSFSSDPVLLRKNQDSLGRERESGYWSASRSIGHSMCVSIVGNQDRQRAGGRKPRVPARPPDEIQIKQPQSSVSISCLLIKKKKKY